MTNLLESTPQIDRDNNVFFEFPTSMRRGKLSILRSRIRGLFNKKTAEAKEDPWIFYEYPPGFKVDESEEICEQQVEGELNLGNYKPSEHLPSIEDPPLKHISILWESPVVENGKRKQIARYVRENNPIFTGTNVKAYRGWDRVRQCWVFVKVKSNVGEDIGVEGKTQARFEDFGFVQILDQIIDTENKREILIMELLEREMHPRADDVIRHERIAGREFKFSTVAKIIIKIADRTKLMRDGGIINNDLKTGNLFLVLAEPLSLADKERRTPEVSDVKLGDQGIANSVLIANRQASMMRNPIDEHNPQIRAYGTPTYISPEIYRMGNDRTDPFSFDERSRKIWERRTALMEVYPLAAIAYEFLTGYIFMTASEEEMKEMYLKDDPQKLLVFLSEQLKNLELMIPPLPSRDKLIACMEKAFRVFPVLPEIRYSSPEEFAEQLGSILLQLQDEQEQYDEERGEKINTSANETMSPGMPESNLVGNSDQQATDQSVETREF